MQCFSSRASQSCTRESCGCFPILLGKWSKPDWNNLHNYTANGRRFGNRILNAAQSSILWIGQRWGTQYAFLASQTHESFVSKRIMETRSLSYCNTGALATLSMPLMQFVHYQGSIILRQRSPARNMWDPPRETLMYGDQPREMKVNSKRKENIVKYLRLFQWQQSLECISNELLYNINTHWWLYLFPFILQTYYWWLISYSLTQLRDDRSTLAQPPKNMCKNMDFFVCFFLSFFWDTEG